MFGKSIMFVHFDAIDFYRKLMYFETPKVSKALNELDE